MTNKFQQLLASKRGWEVMSLENVSPVPGAYETIQRALALRHLEIPVGNFIEEVTRREKELLGEDGLSILESNILDEEKHDRQLNNAFELLKRSSEYNPEYEKEGLQIQQKWIQAAEKHHPILVALVAENAIFFPLLTILRRLGGTTLASVANEINRDETIHVSTNRYVAFDLLGYKVSPELDSLREETINWLVEKLPGKGIPGKYGRASNYTKASQDLLYKGTFNEFQDTRKAQFFSFFEISGANLPIYG